MQFKKNEQKIEEADGEIAKKERKNDVIMKNCDKMEINY